MSDQPSRNDESPVAYPWYRSVDDGSLEQGDLLFRLPTLMLASSYDELIADNPAIEIISTNAIILTQSCDLSAGKIEQVVVCPIFPMEVLKPKVRALRQSGAEKNVKNGRIESLYLLPPSDVAEQIFTQEVVNFRQVATVPLAVIEEHARRQMPRIRLQPPYREHLAQAFARFIMRIGFPRDFET